MPINYTLEGKAFTLRYQELKEHYVRFCEMSDEEFITNLHDALHIACIICFLKEVPTYVCLSDAGIVHELVHLLDKKYANEFRIQEARKLFELTLKLA